MSRTALGNDKGWRMAAFRRIEAVLDEAVLSGALTPEERRLVVLVERSALRHHLAPPPPLMTNAVAGPQTVTPRGVSR